MIIMVDARIVMKDEKVTGYFEVGDSCVLFEGFINYLKDNGYDNIKIYVRKGGLVLDDDVNKWKSIVIAEKLKSFQLEFSNAIKSLNYYPDSPENNMMRIKYSKLKLTYQHFEVPNTRAKFFY